MAVTDEAIDKIRELILSGALAPGAKLPPEQELAAQLGLSRSSMREAVKALVMARVLTVRRGDGTYVTSLQPQLLLDGLGLAIDLVQDHTVLELVEVRRLLEPAATALAAVKITAAQLAELDTCLDGMRAAGEDLEKLVHFDAAFHTTVVTATGNRTLVSILDGISSRTLRSRVWRGLVETNAAANTVAEHEAIYRALSSGDSALAKSAAHVHVNTSEVWLRNVLENRPPDPES